ncbi:hypothetical protein OEZ86_001991 [Tetradesmus obliquus]|nr:hypothetical protein OEZ86_001991 [Tetradesmus obliquus]
MVQNTPRQGERALPRQLSGSFTGDGRTQQYLPGLTMPAGHQLPDSLTTAEDGDADVDGLEIEKAYVEAEAERLQLQQKSLLAVMLNINSVLTDAAAAMVDDSFLKCFTSAAPDPWNWNFYLAPIWLLGMLFRHLVLFPLRLTLLLTSHLLFFMVFFTVKLGMPSSALKLRVEQRLIRFLCGMYVASWTGVIKFHGPKPVPEGGHVWVANHTSMIDYIILSSYTAFAVIMQLHPGWVGFLQTTVLDSLGCLWFNRTQAKDRSLVAQRMADHVADPNTTPLLIFPEGTCVNNEYCVMFKRGAFDMGATVHPVAIKYNKIFVDAFWNSKRLSFTQHLVRLMSSWAVVCDVYFLEPQSRREDESVDEFAARVQAMIAKQAKLRVVPWDGYLKYYNLGEKHPGLIEKRRKVFADQLKTFLPAGGAVGSSKQEAVPAAAAAAAGKKGSKKAN